MLLFQPPAQHTQIENRRECSRVKERANLYNCVSARQQQIISLVSYSSLFISLTLSSSSSKLAKQSQDNNQSGRRPLNARHDFLMKISTQFKENSKFTSFLSTRLFYSTSTWIITSFGLKYCILSTKLLCLHSRTLCLRHLVFKLTNLNSTRTPWIKSIVFHLSLSLCLHLLFTLWFKHLPLN